VEEQGLNLSGSGEELVKGLCKHDSETSGVIICGERIDDVGNFCQVKDSVA
jgi:hypothetical protein